MHRPRIARFEALEPRSLLAAAPSGLADSITESPKTATSGTVLAITFTEKNVSHHDIRVDYGPQIDGFQVNQNGHLIWESNGGIQPAFVISETLKPGQSLTLKATWDGRSNLDAPDFGEFGPDLTGKFTVSDQLAPGQVTTVTLLPPRTPGRSHH